MFKFLLYFIYLIKDKVACKKNSTDFMQIKKNTEVLRSPWFLLGLFTLLVNDFYLKANFPGFVTGKLSDVAGLFIFPFFFSALLHAYKKHIYFLTAILFILWKLPISNGVVTFLNSNYIPINRVTDLTDLITLLILPVSFFYFKKQSQLKMIPAKVQTYFISIICIFAFCATSLAQIEGPLKIKIDKQYKLAVSRSHLIKKYLNKSACSFDERSNYYYAYFTTMINKHEVSVDYLMSIKKLTDDTTIVSIDSVLGYSCEKPPFSNADKNLKKYFEGLSKVKYEVIFLKNFNELIKEKDSTYSETYIRSRLIVDSVERGDIYYFKLEADKKLKELMDSVKIIEAQK